METVIPVSPRRQHVPMEAIACLEMELDHSDCDDDQDQPLNAHKNPRGTSPLVELAQGLVVYIKLCVQLYPRTSLGMSLLVVLIFLIHWSPLSPGAHGRDGEDMTRNYLERDYSSLATDYDFQKANVHHWCLFGGNEKCLCEDPTVDQSREEVRGWSNAHQRNIQQINDNSITRHGGKLDVVFVGDQTFQMWGEGKLLEKSSQEGDKIAAYFNQTFRNSNTNGGVHGISLGIYTDRATNLLWRLKHGEMPKNLKAKIWWILIGADDLSLAMCSEDMVTLGVLRVAEEIAFHNPDSKVVIQGLLPRSNHKDGSLHMTDDKRGSSFRDNNVNLPNQGVEAPFEKNNVWAYRTHNVDPNTLDQGHSTTSSAIQQAQEQAKQPYFDYYIWPSILAINQELKAFCDKHSSQFVYFDADDLFVETVDGGLSEEKRIIKDLMPNSILLGYKGHKVLMDTVKTKLKELLRR